MSLRDQRQLCGHPLTYATARVLLAGDSEVVEEEYMMSGSVHAALRDRSSTFRNYTRSEPRFRALLTVDGAQRLDLSRS
jgi:hypothetical protein